MTKCMFHNGSTTATGKFEAPEKCKKALFEKYKKAMERCEITNKQECPLRSFIPCMEDGVSRYRESGQA